MHNRKITELRKSELEHIQLELLRLKYQTKLSPTLHEFEFFHKTEEEKQAIHQQIIGDLIRITSDLRTIIYNTPTKDILNAIKLPVYQMLCLLTKSPYQYANFIYILTDFVHCFDKLTEKQADIIGRIATDLWATFYAEANHPSISIEQMIEDHEKDFIHVNFWKRFPTYLSAFEQKGS